ncbi:MAG: hypothetical protein V1706_15235 [Pseudomonadota bacterium]
MTYFQNFIVYLWFFPVLLFIMLPLAVSTGGIVVGVTTKAFTALKKNRAFGQEDRPKPQDALDKRKDPRVVLSGAEVVVSDGFHSCSGFVCNISRFGMSLAGLPEKFYKEANKLSVVLKGQDRDYSMQLQPKWVRIVGSQRIGGELENVSAGWSEFIDSFQTDLQAEVARKRQ